MPPVGALHERGRTIIVQQCLSCGHVWRNRAADADDPDAILALFGRVVPDSPATRAQQARPKR
jgi:hypothetical protein